MISLRLSIRKKLVLLSVLFIPIPWLGYQFIWEMEDFLRVGQEQTLLGTARAVATALHERPGLFDSSNLKPDQRPGGDLYAHKLSQPIELNGNLDDWQTYANQQQQYGQLNLITPASDYNPQSLSFRHMVGQHRQYLYAMFEVTDDVMILRQPDVLSISSNDHILMALTTPDGQLRQFVVSPTDTGWANAYELASDDRDLGTALPDASIQAYWKRTPKGFNVELRFPLDWISGRIAFALVDVDDPTQRAQEFVVGTADPDSKDSLGTVLLPSSEIERIILALEYAYARVWVIDEYQRVLARAGSIFNADGFAEPDTARSQTLWNRFEESVLLPLYYQILSRPPAEFIDELENASQLKGQDIANALQGKSDSLWRLTGDGNAVILSATHPIFVDGQVKGAVVVEQTTKGIRSLRNRALEKLFHMILLVMGMSALVLFLFASTISTRIRSLRNQTESAIDRHGKIVHDIAPSNHQDEIGDLSRTFVNVLQRLDQYNSYLENMSARLSHELRTPVAVVSSSLDILAMLPENASASQREEYVERAQLGIKRLSAILTSMSEATRLEQAIQAVEPEAFDLSEVVNGCMQGYQLAYKTHHFMLSAPSSPLTLRGSPELVAQMLDKIVANAIDFAPQDSIVQLSLKAVTDGCQLVVSNEGPLLPEGMQNKLVDSMVSVRPASHGSAPHLGLGLHIARLVADFHGGHLTIDNRVDRQGVDVTVAFRRNL